jgi:flagellar L-ring protein precursor FlgH
LNKPRVIASSCLVVALAGCAQLSPRDLPPERVYLPAAGIQAGSVPDGSIFSKAGQGGLTGTDHARRAGDLVTVLLEEQMSASTSASSNASRNSATTALTPGALASIDRRFGSAGLPWPVDINPGKSAIDSSGQGSAEQQGRITGEVTAVVTEVLPNGLLAVRGYKRMELARGTQVIRLTGLVRPTDIQPDNPVRSRRLADADISVASRGELADASRSGWMNRALLLLWPF